MNVETLVSPIDQPVEDDVLAMLREIVESEDIEDVVLPGDLVSPVDQPVEDDVLDQLRGMIELSTLGGSGSGNFGHSGRPGEVGGSGIGATEWTSGGASHDLRAKEIGVPPAWTNVKINKNPDANLLATGKDSKGRTTYLYSAAHAERAAAEKFARLKEFNGEINDIRKRVKADLANPNLSHEEREAASVLTLIDKTAFRVGSENETGADKQAYGATTLDADHVRVHGDKVEFNFVGKKGVDIQKTVKDKELADILRPRVKKGGKLFDTTDNKVRDYLHSRDGDFKIKDFRTWHGTTTALRAMKDVTAPTTEKEFKAARKAVGKVVAEHLGNTPAVALSSYIDPGVWGKWKSKLIKN